jgi:hypothetical protein
VLKVAKVSPKDALEIKATRVLDILEETGITTRNQKIDGELVAAQNATTKTSKFTKK